MRIDMLGLPMAAGRPEDTDVPLSLAGIVADPVDPGRTRGAAFGDAPLPDPMQGGTLSTAPEPAIAEPYAAAEARIAAREAMGGPPTDIASRLVEKVRNGVELARRLRAGKADAGDIAASEVLGEIDSGTARRLRASYDAARESARREMAGIARVDAALAEGRKLRPDDANDRAAVDAHYSRVRDGWAQAGLDPDEVREALTGYIAEGGCIPPVVVARIGSIFRTGDPSQRWEAADLITRLVAADPALVRQLDPRDVAMGLGIGALARAGFRPGQAAARYAELLSGQAADVDASRDQAIVAASTGGAVAAASPYVVRGNGGTTGPVAPETKAPPPPLPKPAPPEQPLYPYPPNKEEVLGSQVADWNAFYRALERLPGITSSERHALMQVFGLEGGSKPDSENANTVAGIVTGDFNDLMRRKPVPGIAAGTKAADLSIEQRALYYRAYFDDVLGTVGGGTAIGRIADPGAAAAFADTLFRVGRGAGTAMIQRAINAVRADDAGRSGEPPALVKEDRQMGKETFDAFLALADQPETRKLLLDALAVERLRGAVKEGDRKRAESYRPQ